MAKSFRSLQRWNHWLTGQQGQAVLLEEKKVVHEILSKFPPIYCAVTIGVPAQQSLLQGEPVRYSVQVSPLTMRSGHFPAVEADPEALPIASGRADLVIVPHALEHTARPQHLLAEACRIVRPQGHILLTGFNPYGMWGIKKLFPGKQAMPWKGKFLARRRVMHWLTLNTCRLVQEQMLLFRPPVKNSLFEKLSFLERAGPRLYRPLGGVWLLVAEAQDIPATPIRLRWKQTLPAFSPGLAGPSIRG